MRALKPSEHHLHCFLGASDLGREEIKGERVLLSHNKEMLMVLGKSGSPRSLNRQSSFPVSDSQDKLTTMTFAGRGFGS